MLWLLLGWLAASVSQQYGNLFRTGIADHPIRLTVFSCRVNYKPYSDTTSDQTRAELKGSATMCRTTGSNGKRTETCFPWKGLEPETSARAATRISRLWPVQCCLCATGNAGFVASIFMSPFPLGTTSVVKLYPASFCFIFFVKCCLLGNDLHLSAYCHCRFLLKLW
jgi:hypothetical protein